MQVKPVRMPLQHYLPKNDNDDNQKVLGCFSKRAHIKLKKHLYQR